MKGTLYNQIHNHLRQHYKEFDKKCKEYDRYHTITDDSYIDCYFIVEMTDGSEFTYGGNCMTFADLLSKMDVNIIYEMWFEKPLEDLEGSALVAFCYQTSNNQEEPFVVDTINF